MREKGLRPALYGKLRIQCPVLLGNKGIDLILSVPDHAQRHRLNPAGREPALDLRPQEGGDLITDHAVQDPPRLLGVDQVHVQLPGIFERLCDRLFSDLVKSDPRNLFIR